MKGRTAFLAGAWVFFAALCLPGSRLNAEDLKPDEVKISTPVYQPGLPDFKPALGTYVYDISWQGIFAAQATVSVEREGENLVLSTSVRTARAIELLYRLRYNASAHISAANLLPLFSKYHKQENSKIRDTEIKFLPDGEIKTVRSKEDGTVERLDFNPENLTLDPFSAAFLARSLDWKKGVTKYFDTYEGKNRYLIALTAVDKVQLKVNDGVREAWVIVPKVRKLGGPMNVKKLRRAEIFLTTDDAREVLMVKSEVFIGSVKTRLVSFTPSTRRGDGTYVAQNIMPRKVYVR